MGRSLSPGESSPACSQVSSLKSSPDRRPKSSAGYVSSIEAGSNHEDPGLLLNCRPKSPAGYVPSNEAGSDHEDPGLLLNRRPTVARSHLLATSPPMRLGPIMGILS